MKVLVIGSGGREHTLIWKLSQSKKVSGLYCIPGNGGTGELAESTDINIDDFKALEAFVKEKAIGLVVVGPEAPLAEGITDYFNEKGIPVFGPDRKSSQLEASKAFSKDFMKKHGIPTAAYEVFDDAMAARAYIEKQPGDFRAVVKADGLAAGKGVLICDSKAVAIEAVNTIIEKKEFGSAGNRVIIEDMLEGEEASMMAFCDGSTIVPMMPSQDHKRIYDGDQGPNTGGMGAYAPAPVVTSEIYDKVRVEVFDNFLKGIKAENLDYRGVVYAGIMIDAGKINVLEFNVRFGDPETQVVLPLLETDIVDIFMATIEGKLKDLDIKWKDESCVCIVIAAGGYPAKYEKGKAISGLDSAGQENTMVFHAGTRKNGEVLTAGGRVLGVTGTAGELREAISLAYERVKGLNFEDMQYRKDIGAKGLKHDERST